MVTLDPFAASFTIFGACVAILNLGISTVEKTAEKWRDWRECRDRLTGYRNHLITCEEKLQAWKGSWIDSLRERDDYIHFWGQKGLEGVLTRIEMIEGYGPEVKRHLPTRDAHKRSDPGFWSTFGLVASESSALKDDISKMQGYITDLYEYSNLQFEKMHDCNLNGREMCVFLDELLRSRNLRNEFSTWMSTLLKALSNNIRETVGILLRIPAEVDEIALDESGLQVRLLIEKAVEGSSRTLIVGLEFHRERAKVSTEQLLVQCGPSYSSPCVVTKNLFSSFARDHVDNSPADDEISQAAWGLAAWTFLLVRTQWTIHLCSCFLRIVSYEKSSWDPVLLAGDARHCQSRRLDVDGHEFFCLGITLAELILRMPFNVSIRIDAHGDQVISIQSGQVSFEKELLLRNIGRISLVYMDAVKYCLKLDAKMDDHVWAQDYNRFLHGVLKP